MIFMSNIRQRFLDPTMRKVDDFGWLSRHIFVVKDISVM